MNAASLRPLLLLAIAGLVLRCDGTSSSSVDAGTGADASQTTQDAGTPNDAGSTDAGTVDAGAEDGGEADAGESPDAGESVDAGMIDGTQLTASLDGDQVVPSVTTSATGTATFVIDSSRKKLTYSITQNVANATAVDIRIGVEGQNGLQAYSLTPVNPTMTGTISISAIHATQLEAGNWHLIVHSPMYPDGEIRGQIEKTP